MSQNSRQIELRGVAVHNLQEIDLDIRHGQLVVVCGVSGSGKTSLALDTLYAEGQRRYIESFPVDARRFLDRLEKPAAKRIEHIPPAIAVTRKNPGASNRATVASATEILNYLRLLMAEAGQLRCYQCQQKVVAHDPQKIAAELMDLPEGTRFMTGFPVEIESDFAGIVAGLVQEGFVRGAINGSTVDLPELQRQAEADPGEYTSGQLLVIVDRLTAGGPEDRLRDSLETAFAQHGRVFALVAQDATSAAEGGERLELDGRNWRLQWYSEMLRCDTCGIDYPAQQPAAFSFNHPLGACPECEGAGEVSFRDMDLIVPDRSKSLRDGAVAPWNTPAYKHELEELLELAEDYDLPVDAPFETLTAAQVRIVEEGVPERNFGGLRGFFRWLEKRKYKMHLRVFLSRWRSWRKCAACDGARLRRESLATRLNDANMAEITGMEISQAEPFFRELTTQPLDRAASVLLKQIITRLEFLCAVGAGYLQLDRAVRTLSSGEAQRVALTSSLGSNLVHMLYVLDEPSAGLHPSDVPQLLEQIQRIRDRGNTVLLVEHGEAIMRAADELIEIGPAAGKDGGQVVYQGPPAGITQCQNSVTGDFLAGRRGGAPPGKRRKTDRGTIRLRGAAGNNLKQVDVEFPLGVLTVVTGVSGSGKSTLVQDTLYGALCQKKDKKADPPLAFKSIAGDRQIDDVMLIDQTPIGRSARSNPVTYIKAFDEIRSVFAATLEARTHNFKAGHFSFNVDGGRCDKCQGEGRLAIDMQFLPDVHMVCSQCGGNRYKDEILSVQYRGRNIAEVLRMTVREAFSFFRGQTKVQAKLKQLIDTGLEYLQLGQPASTLSTGEAQRLKLATYMSAARRSRTLFLLDEPATGLHFADITRLLDCFSALLSVGHSLVIVEHNLQLIREADHIIDLGPGAAARGGEIVVAGTPEEVAACQASATGRYLAASLAGG